jgi:hypothetical protein
MSDALLPIEALLADDDDTGNLLAVMTMVDRQFRARRPIGNVSDFVWFVRLPSLDIAHGTWPSFSLPELLLGRWRYHRKHLTSGA